MKYISTLIVMLTLICHSHYYSQTNSKDFRLKVKDVKTVEKNGKTSWTVKTILTNHSRDTLFYFSYVDCEAAFYSVRKIFYKSDIRNDTLIDDGNSLSIDKQKCGAAKQTVISVPPSGQRIVNLELVSQNPLTSSIKFFITLYVYKAKNMYDISHVDLMQQGSNEKRMSVNSKFIKIKPPAGNSK